MGLYPLGAGQPALGLLRRHERAQDAEPGVRDIRNFGLMGAIEMEPWPGAPGNPCFTLIR